MFALALAIISLSLPLKDEIPSLIVNSITPLVFDTEFIDQLNDVAISMHRKIPVHLKIDTGMGRVGCSKEEASTLAKKIENSGIKTFALTDHDTIEGCEEMKSIISKEIKWLFFNPT